MAIIVPITVFLFIIVSTFMLGTMGIKVIETRGK